MRLNRFFTISTSIVPLALSASANAQAASGIQIFTGINNSFPGGAGVAGFGLTLGNGAIAVRGSFGAALSPTATRPSAGATTPSKPRQWIGDADIVIGDGIGGLSGLLGGAVVPYAFAGVGAQSVAASPSVSNAIRNWSYGGGVTLPLSANFGIVGEGRYRNHLGNNSAPPVDFVPGTEYRVGISVHFGSGGLRGGYRTRSSRPPASRRSGGASTRTNWPASSTSAAGAARRVVPDAEQYIGVPYVYGGTSPQTGFDCSGFVQYVYARQGVDLPRTARQMVGSGMSVNPTAGSMTIGDLMLFSQGGRISHVALYAGSGRFLHSSSSGRGVRYDDLNTRRGRWFADHMVAVRRVAPDGRAVMSAFAQSLIPFDHFDPPDSAPPPIKR